MNTNILLGNTPLIKLSSLTNAQFFAKLEYYNPTFSIKDRAAFNMIKVAFEKGQIKENGVVIEATSGNTGLGICYAATKFKLNVICTVFEEVPKEKINLLKAFGATVIICSSKYASESENGYVGLARSLSKKIKNSFYVDQFNNENNISAHYLYTGPEIYEQMNFDLDYIFATIGTGGTISGISKYLYEKNKNIKVIGIEPIGGLYQSHFRNNKCEYEEHLIQSISDDFVSNNFIKDYLFDVIQISDDKSFSMCYKLLREEGLCVGTSGGCCLAAANEYIAKYEKNNRKRAVCIIPDNGLKYLDTLYNEKYLRDNKLYECLALCNTKEQITENIKLEYPNVLDIL